MQSLSYYLGKLISSRPVSTQIEGTDNGLVTNSVIHGKTTAGGGGYVDVKVSPSGALQTEINSQTENGAVAIGNAIAKFRDGFLQGTIDPTVWDIEWRNQADSFTSFGGNSSGAGYLRVSMSPYQAGSEFILTSKQKWKMPHRFGFGVSASQRIIGQEFEIALVGCDDDGIVDKATPIPSMPISGSVVVASSIATINFATPHPYRGGDRVYLIGNTDKRLDIGPVVVTVVNRTQITVPTSLTSTTYTAGGQVVHADYFDGAYNGGGIVFENAATTNATVVSRRNGSKYYGINTTHITSSATQQNTSGYTDAFRSSGDFEFISTMEYFNTSSRSASSTSATTGYSKYTETVLDEEKYYKIQIRMRNSENFSFLAPCYVVSATKSGTTTATITTSAPHGLSVGDFVQIYGIRDTTNFPALTSATAILSVPTTTSFTVVIGTTTTGTSEGGIISATRGGVATPGATTFSIQSFDVASDVLRVTLNTTASGFIPGEVYEVVMNGAGASYNGAYICMRMVTTQVEFMKVDYSAIPTITSTNCGGAIVRRTDYRVHYVRQLEYTRHLVELSNNRGATDAGLAIPVLPAGGSISAITTLTTLTTLNNLNGYQAHQASFGAEYTAWATNVRNLIT